MRSMVYEWKKRPRYVYNSEDELPEDLISMSDRVRKRNSISEDCFAGSDKERELLAEVPKSEKVTRATATAKKLEDSVKVETESVKMETNVAPRVTFEGRPKQETVKDNNKSRVDPDLLQKVLAESVEEWFSLAEVVTNNKGKPYRKKKIVVPPMHESDFCFELTETKDNVENQGGGGQQVESKSDEQPETRQSEKSKEEVVALKTNEKKKELEDVVIKREYETTIPTDESNKTVEDIVKKEKDESFGREDVETMSESSRVDERGENEKENLTENWKDKSYRQFFALFRILYGDQINREGRANVNTSDFRQGISSQQQITVANTSDLERAYVQDFGIDLDEFCNVRKHSPISESEPKTNGIERLFQTRTTGSTLRKSRSAECLNVFSRSYNDGPVRSAECFNVFVKCYNEGPMTSAELSAMLPSSQRKMNSKDRASFPPSRRDETAEKCKRKVECGTEQEVEKLEEKRKTEINAKEIINDRVERETEGKTNQSDSEKVEEENVNRLVEEKVEAGLEMKRVTNIECTKAGKVMTNTEIDSEKDNKMAEMKLKKRKRNSPRKDKFFSYVNKIKRKSGCIYSMESAESQVVSNEELTPTKPVESTQETRVNEKEKTEAKKEAEVGETRERRMSQREIKLTPKLVHMIATSHKRTKSTCEDGVSGLDSGYPNLLKKVVSGSGTPEVVESPRSASANENCLQSSMETNASNFESSLKPGDLVWARFGGNPFWPSLILEDPFSNDEYTKVRHWGRLLKTFVHLQFLADSGKRAWVPQLYCMSYKGLDEFEKMKSNLPKIYSFTKRNDILYQKAFFPSKKVEKAWLDAVKEGEALLKRPTDERITFMKIKYPLVKYAESVANGQLVGNESTFGESENPQLKATKRKLRSNSRVEFSDWPDSGKVTTRDEPSTEMIETFECVRPTEAEVNGKGDEKEMPKITLKLVRSPKKGGKRKWSKSLEEDVEGQLSKKPKKDVLASTYTVSISEGSSGNQKEVEPSRRKGTKQQDCLRMVEKEKFVKCEGGCPRLFPSGAEVLGVEEGAGTALNARNRRRKFSFPRVNRWKRQFWAIFDFYNEFGNGWERDGVEVQRLFAVYRSLRERGGAAKKSATSTPQLR